SYWPMLVKDPSGEKSMDDFALAIHNVPKIVFSKMLKNVTWENTTLATKSLKEEVLTLRQQAGKDVFVGSPSLISALHSLHLIDEYQLCVHPVIVGMGLPLFKNVTEKTILKLINTKTFSSGGLIHYYVRSK
ncbi:MAG TPA: dihydrofolate reductase family protein, partial [Bacteroidia bacterium]|nr:dihydrofolate reductase family protein [Bacteroidia bacterium]